MTSIDDGVIYYMKQKFAETTHLKSCFGKI